MAQRRDYSKLTARKIDEIMAGGNELALEEK
jgi:hypothetical protein